MRVVAKLEQIRGVHLLCGCIYMFHGGYICGEILTKLIDFAFFGGACAPPNYSVASPLDESGVEVMFYDKLFTFVINL
jgi:hypothetical protein